MASGSVEQERKRRAIARWAILRSALLGESPSSTNKEASIHRFEGYRMLPRRIVEKSEEYSARLSRCSCLYESRDVALSQIISMVGVCSDCCGLFGRTKEKVTIEMHGNSVGGIDMEGITWIHSALEARGLEASWKVETVRTCETSRALWSVRCGKPSPKGMYECVEYQIPVKDNVPVRIRVRERTKSDSTKIDLKALTSHRHYGVDNTGNSCVWDSESTLTYCLINSGLSESPVLKAVGYPGLLSLVQQRRGLQVVELGAGMAGLAGLTLGAITLHTQYKDNSMRVLLTDGHPESVRNNVVNAHLSEALYPHDDMKCTIDSSLLLWKDSAEGASDCARLVSRYKSPFDLCLASDCVHFQEFHAALMLTIARLLRVGGVAVLCQPQRATSLQRFVELLEAVNKKSESPLWQIKLLNDYDETMSRRHEAFLETDSSYDPSIHYPVLLVLRKIRALCEEADRTVAVRHMKERDVASS